MKKPLIALALLTVAALTIGGCAKKTPAQLAQERAARQVNSPSFKATDAARIEANKRIEVTYEITGTAQAVSLTWENDTGGTNQGDYKVPFKVVYRLPTSTTFLYISAQIIQPTSGTPKIECRILVEGQEFAKAEASGFAAIATCSP